jgi:hypothetical protein
MSPAAAASTKTDFNRDIRPILSENCFACHGPDDQKRKSGLRLDQRESATKPAKSGATAIAPGKPAASEIVRRITTTDEDDRMPPAKSGKHLTAAQAALLRQWVAEGAPYQGHWAFITPGRPAIPKVRQTSWPKNPLDFFVLARLENEGLKPGTEVDRATLIRRVTLDLTGLPPTPAEVDAFLKDRSSDAYESLVDRLLASSRYGEHMARAWLDAARYADTNGYNNDEERTHWPWRDWVIEAFNRNLPFDRFLTEQLAGDLLPNPTRDQRVATAFNRNHVLTTEGGIIDEEYRVEYVADRVHTTATVFMGLTFQCARCHDHKFDPFTQRDYYRLFAYFNNVPDKAVRYNTVRAAEPVLRILDTPRQAELEGLQARARELDEGKKARTADADAAFRQWLGALSAEPPEDLKKAGLTEALKISPEKRTDAQTKQLLQYFLDNVDAGYRSLKSEADRAAKRLKELDAITATVMVMGDLLERRQTYVLKRGQYDQHGEIVEAGTPGSLLSPPQGAPANRLGLARWLTDPSHPLTARVAVNRWWEGYFGAGLVETIEDFGAQGSYPSHPELLDWLATELIRTGWDVKAMQRRIVMSATYRQGSAVTPRLLERDPANRLLARGPRFRMPAEMIRDQALAVSGLLREKIGGPSVKPYQPPGLWEDVSVERRYTYVADNAEGLYRRSLYTFWKRTCPPPGMTTLDAPDREFCVARRARTSTPLQALLLMNDITYVEAGRKMAERLMQEGGATRESRLDYAFRLALARAPKPAERKLLSETFEEARTRFRGNPAAAAELLKVGESPRDQSLDTTELAAWTVVASMVLNLDEMLTKP